MSSHSAPRMTIEEQLSYWKWDFTSLDLFSSELAYSLVFENIRPDRIADALQTVGLTVLPDRFLLIQIDDYASLSKKLEITREFFQKDLVVNTIRAYLKELRLPGFAANLINTDRVICFLCLEEYKLAAVEEFLLDFVQEVRRRVRLHTSYTLSVCISDRCTGLSHFPPMYIQLQQALDWTFYYGHSADLTARDGQVVSSPVDLQQHYSGLLAAVGQHNEQQIRQRAEQLFQTLSGAKLQPQQTRVEIVRLIHRVEAGCVQRAVPDQTAAAISGRYAEQILSSQFFSGIRELFLEFCQQIVHILEQFDSNPELRFKTSVQAYISRHYSDPIWLEDIARTFNFSPCYFTQVFKKQFGVTLNQFLTRFRVEKGRELLEQTSLSVENIAFLTGFNSRSYFCATFKRLVGMSPTRYRQRAGNVRAATDSESFG